MKKIILITFIFFLYSFPTMSKEIKGKGLFCFENKGKVLAFYFFGKGYEQWFREWIDLDGNGQRNIRLFWNKDQTIYKLNEDYITLHLKMEIDKKHYYKINRYDLTMRYISHGKKTKEFYNCEIFNSRTLLLKKIEHEDIEFNKQLEEKLEKRKF